MENPIKMDDLGVPLLLETPIYKWGILGLQPIDPNLLILTSWHIQAPIPPDIHHIWSNQPPQVWLTPIPWLTYTKFG